MKKNKKTFFIDPQYTLSFAARFLAVASAGFIILGISLFLALNRNLGAGYFQDISILNDLEEKFPAILFTTGTFQAIVITLLFLVIALFWAHKVAGPIVRFRRYLNSFSTREPADDMAFREDDQLQYLAEVFRKTQGACWARRKQRQDELHEAERMIHECEFLSSRKDVDQTQLNQKLAALKAVYTKLRASFGKEKAV